jgi:transmembrane sensor
VVLATLVAASCFWLLSAGRIDAGPLRDAQGEVVSRLGGEKASVTSLSDGSRIELSPDSELEILDNDSSVFSCVLRKGRGMFEVKPGGPRRWQVETSLVLVEVLGTRFSVERRDNETRVDVEHGSVVVRGARVPDGVQKLAAGERLVVAPSPRAVAGMMAPSATSSATPRLEPSPAGGSREAPARVAEPPRSPPADLLQSADEQRRRGDVRGAIQTLRTAVARGAEQPRRAIAAFTLGKLLLDAAGQPAEAEAAFRTCLRLSPPSSVAEDALARLVQAQVRAGKADAARNTARQYEQRYPGGRRLADVQRWANTR